MTTSDSPLNTCDALAAVRSLSASAIRQRIEELDAERRALLPLLRSAIARERAKPANREATR